MNGNTNPYISATRGFLRSYQDYQKMRWQMENAEVDRQYRQSVLGISRGHLDLARQRELRLSRPEQADPYEVYGQMQRLVKDGMPPELGTRGLMSKGALSAFSPYQTEALFPTPADKPLLPSQQMTQEWLNQWNLFTPQQRTKAAEQKFLPSEEPEKYSAEYFEKTLGYSPETAKILQDRRFGALPKLRSPAEQVRDARMIIENALSAQEMQIGEEMLREAIEDMAKQRAEKPLFEAKPERKTTSVFAPTALPEEEEPESYSDFETKVGRLKAQDAEKAKEYYNKWIGKFQK